MAIQYASIKGAQGVAPGVIVPFSRNVQNAGEQMDRVPGGYLRCDGKVYQASDYPDLARVVGVGSAGGSGIPSCRFPPGIAGTSLLNPTVDADGNFTAGTFCVPNLGAKHLQPSNSAGSEFLGDTAMSGGGIVERAGIGYKAQVQPSANTSYMGYIRCPEFSSSTSGSPILTVDQSSLAAATIGVGQIEEHDHGAGAGSALAPKITQTPVVGIDTDLTEIDKYGNNKWQGPSIGITSVAVAAPFNIETTGNADVNHSHSLGGSTASNLLEFTQPQIDISFSGSTATCQLTADTREHLNHVSSPYMILEFIIKY